MSRLHWVALATFAGLGGKSITRLLEHFGSLEAVFAAPVRELAGIRRIGRRTAEAIARVDLAAVEAEIAAFTRQEIAVLTWEDAAYPANLLRAPDAPPVLFVKGTLKPGDVRAVAIVGTRTPTPAGAALAQHMARELSSRGWAIVSGLALGIDAAAHRGALEAGGRTLAVLGSGVASIYPRQHRPLSGAIERQGALLSEGHPGAGVTRRSLIARNRITSGLSRAVIVVESSTDSGSASTARRALAQGRPVFAIGGDGAEDGSFLEDGVTVLRLEELGWDALSEHLDRIVIPPAKKGVWQPRLL